jgi:hypothetical protein
MIGCRIKRTTFAAEKPMNPELAAAAAAKLAAMIAERDKQDKTFAQNVLSESEYEVKYGKQPEAESK